MRGKNLEKCGASWVLRGNAPAKIDDKGRLKIPNSFLAYVQKEFGPELFVTSLDGEHVRIYPLTVWMEIERKLAQIPSTNPAKIKFLDRINFYGQPTELDKQGRVLIPTRLRAAANMTGEVDVLGLSNHLAVWNHERFLAKMQREPFTDEDARALSQFGI
jgi:MraZ protein